MREIFNVANPKWGTKRMCLSCGQRFYDMRREPIVCPSCDAPFELNSPARTRRSRAPVERKEAAPPPEPLAATEDGAQTPAEDTEMAAIESEEADSDIEVEVEEESAETIEDPSELGEDEDDMAEVIEGIEQPEKKDV